MSELVITNAHIVTPTQVIRDGWLHCQRDTIVAYGTGDAPSGTRYDAQGAYLLPGLVDVHVHGAVGRDVMDADADGLREMAQFFARHGVTSFLPTTLTASRDATTAALKSIRAAMQSPTGGARILGAHLEGPYINPAKSGAQNKDHIRPINEDELCDWLDLDVIRLVSLAPELDNSAWAIAECQRRGVTVSAAHTAATFEQIQHAIDRGLSHATHTYNAMPSLHHREPGALAALMLAPTVRCEVIADTVHVHPAMIRLLTHVIGLDRLILITDAMRATGMADGAYTLGDYEITVRGQRATLSDGTLAGSVLTMDAALRHFCAITGHGITDAWRVASLNALQSIKRDQQIGQIATGYDADLVVWQMPQMQVQATIAQGQIIYER